jgi:ribosomal protein S27AE
MASKIGNVDSCPKCEASLLVFTHEGPNQYLSCVKCSWKTLTNSNVSQSNAAKAKKQTFQGRQKRQTAPTKPNWIRPLPKQPTPRATLHSKEGTLSEKVTCEACLQVNRLPKDKRGKALCGKCGEKLFPELVSQNHHVSGRVFRTHETKECSNCGEKTVCKMDGFRERTNCKKCGQMLDNAVLSFEEAEKEDKIFMQKFWNITGIILILAALAYCGSKGGGYGTSSYDRDQPWARHKAR